MDTDRKLLLTSPAFADGDTIPEKYSCKGRDYSPPLIMDGIPSTTASLALIMHDPDAPSGDYLHWSVWNINPDVDHFFESWVPDNAIQGTNSSGNIGYTGPCPPSGTHRYIFDLYALDAQLDLAEGAGRDEVVQQIANHMISHTTLTGLFSANNKVQA